MKTLLFLGHSYHGKTGSTEFLLDLLRTEYEVTVLRMEPRTDPAFAALPAHPGKVYDVLACLEVLPPHALLTSRFAFRQGVYFPMYDSCARRSKMEIWHPYRHFQFICFSRTLHRELQVRGFSTHHLQYFPPPAPAFTPGDPAAAFFWNRLESLNIRTVQQLLAGSGVRQIHLHEDLDPWNRFVEPVPDPGLRITRSSWYPAREEMLAAVREAAIYFAPRPKEGIGQSFLEAMAQGRCVIAANRPTMNEYIEHGRTGLLYDLERIRPLQLRDVAGIQRRTWEFMRAGHRAWLENQGQLLRWIAEPPHIRRWRLQLLLGLRLATRSARWRRQRP